ncbi:hypothetical protein K0M31_005716 [Melipona bicolor]|uniref:Uncharacterized protein n=1 Tax=Melipona bicolor TaxID=60889 RepID=A0AA40FU90_9HYME|nr:hypothetical protein K0M31_005716 [Melipona bicolor]
MSPIRITCFDSSLVSMTTVSSIVSPRIQILFSNKGERRVGKKDGGKREMPELCHVVEKLAAKSTKWASSEAILKAEGRKDRGKELFLNTV